MVWDHLVFAVYDSKITCLGQLRRSKRIGWSARTFNCPQKTQCVPFHPLNGLAGAIGSSTPHALLQTIDNGDSLRSSGCLRLVSAPDR